MREEGVALEDIAQSAPLGRHVDPGFAVEEHLAADDDPPVVRPDEPGEALKGQGLAGPGGAEERHDLVTPVPVDLEGERGQSLDHVHLETARGWTRAPDLGIHGASSSKRPAGPIELTGTRSRGLVPRHLNSALNRPYPSASSLSTGMKRSAAEL